MDDIGKAIIMVGQVLLFITALSISVFLYSTLTDRAENIMVANTNNNRGDSIVDVENFEKREVSGAEVVMAILDLKEKSGDVLPQVKINGGDGAGTYYYSDDDSIYTPGGYESYNSLGLRNWLITKVFNSNYEIESYSSSNILEYTKK